MRYATSAPSPANDLFIKPQLRSILFYKNSKLSTPTEIFPRKISKPFFALTIILCVLKQTAGTNNILPNASRRENGYCSLRLIRFLKFSAYSANVMLVIIFLDPNIKKCGYGVIDTYK